jgi:hypothetical protein
LKFYTCSAGIQKDAIPSNFPSREMAFHKDHIRPISHQLRKMYTLASVKLGQIAFS